nr:phospholipase-like protein [Tanacetum cinerariifolium]
MLFDHEPLLIDYMLRRQHKVDDQHHDMPLIYYMKGHSLHFGRREFSLIIGFRFETVNFDLHPSSDLKFCNRVFSSKIGFIITNLDIIGVIEDEERFGKLSDDYAIRLCLLLAVEVIFMGRLLTFRVYDTLFRLVKNLEAWNSFPWDPKVIPRALDWLKKSLFTRSDYSYVFAKESRLTLDLRPTIAEYQSSWWIDNNIYFQEHVPRAQPIKENHSLSETYLAKLKKARKCRKTGFMVLSIEEQHDSNEDISQDYLREEELRLCLEDEEMLRCEHEKLIVEENRFRLDEANMLRLEEKNMLQLEEQNKKAKKVYEFKSW